MPQISALCFTAVLLLAAQSCKEKRQHSMQGMSNEEIKELLMESSRHHAKEEDKRIDQFVKNRKIAVKKTGTGLRYALYSNSDSPCDSISKGDRVWLDYRVSLLDGNQVYSSKLSGPRSFVVDRDDVESGLHEGVKLLCPGDSAYFILPSHLAHGLTGDQREIPSNAPIIYEVQVVQVQ